MPNPLSPSPALLAKLGSIIVHYEEFLSPTGHGFDQAAFRVLVEDAEVMEWMKAMRKIALIPEERSGEPEPEDG